LRFEWDAAKAATNVQKHGVRFEDAITAFDDPLALIMFDSRHSRTEVREILIGRSDVGVLTIVFTIRGGSVRRIIGARRASRTERSQYEKGV
jgi:uncharacterized DUF497 family protein